MKKYLLSLGLIIGMCTHAEKHEPVSFDSFLIRSVDGTSFVSVGSIFDFAHNALAILQGTTIAHINKVKKEFNLTLTEPVENYADESGKCGLMWYKGSYRTLKELREYEKEDANDPELKAALKQACTHFEKFSEDYVIEIETAKGIMVQIIEQWSKLRNRPNSLLLDWSKVESMERDDLYATMTCCDDLSTFLCDLLLFLKDFVQNCPKSYKQYKEQLKQHHATERKD